MEQLAEKAKETMMELRVDGEMSNRIMSLVSKCSRLERLEVTDPTETEEAIKRVGQRSQAPLRERLEAVIPPSTREGEREEMKVEVKGKRERAMATNFQDATDLRILENFVDQHRARKGEGSGRSCEEENMKHQRLRTTFVFGGQKIH